MQLNSWPVFSNDEIQKVSKILLSGKVNYWTGFEGKNFEIEFAKYTDSKYGIVMANGSLALESAYKSIGLTSGDEIITTPRTFIATSSSAVLLGAKPVFADVDLNSGCISLESIEPLINSKTKAISVVHLGGWPAEIEQICKLAKQHNLFVIEDCSQAHGAKIKSKNGWKSVGSFGDVSTWSFCQDKIMTTGGEGGFVSTSNLSIRDICWYLKDHGKTLNAIKAQEKTVGFKWLHDEIGSNYRLSEMQSAIGRIQLKKLEEWNKIRSFNAAILKSELQNISVVRLPVIDQKIRHAWYKFYCYLNLQALSSQWDRNRIIKTINDHGFPAFSGSCSEIYLEKCFKKINKNFNRLKNAKELGETSLMLLVHPSISEEQMTKYAKVVKEVLVQATK